MNVLQQLAKVVRERRHADPQNSWTAKLLQDGRQRCAKKFGEEAVEAVIAGAAGDRKALISESADALFHLLVLLEVNDATIQEVLDELDLRQGVSGIDEKKSRST